MKVTRIYTGDDGESRFEDFDIPLRDAGDIGSLSELVKATGIIFRETAGDYDGGILEFTFGSVERTWMAAVPVYFHPWDEWFIALAPGLEFEGSDGNVLLRLGVGYEFEFKPQWSLVPEFNLDFTDGDTKFVYGFTIFYSF